MEEFAQSINAFLEFRRYDILKDNGKITHKQAMEKAYQEYEVFNKTQPIESDFDKIVKETLESICVEKQKRIYVKPGEKTPGLLFFGDVQKTGKKQCANCTKS